jgi:hypothetical protein
VHMCKCMYVCVCDITVYILVLLPQWLNQNLWV